MNQTGGFSRFLYRNRDRGIPNLMLWIAIGNAVVYLMTRISTTGYVITLALAFDAFKILQGEVWRLVTFVFTYLSEAGLFWGAVSLFFYYWIGKVLEQYWGILRFNLFYASGILIGAAVSLLVAALARFAHLPLMTGEMTASYLNLSLFLAVATLQPDAQVRIWFVLPLKMKWAAWLDLGITAYGLVKGLILMIKWIPMGLIYLGWLIPLSALANYFLFFGKAAQALLPEWVFVHHSHPKKVKQTKAYPEWVRGSSTGSGRGNYRFRCTVCGRTDRSDPGLEFRYCSRCSGYRCYCIDHINNHAHITDTVDLRRD